MPTEIKHKIWGIQFEEIKSDDYLIWKAEIRNPFFYDGKYTIGLNEKFLWEAIKSGVNKILLVIGQREQMMDVPDPKELKRKDKAKEYEDKNSMFKDSPAMRIYHFKV